MKILILDDDPVVALSCSRILKAEGIVVLNAGSVPEARQILETTSFDLLLTDIKMPGLDGFEIIRHVKKKKPLMPVLMMTGFLTLHTLEKARRLGADHYIAKPFTPDELIRAIMETQNKKPHSTLTDFQD